MDKIIHIIHIRFLIKIYYLFLYLNYFLYLCSAEEQ